MIAVWLGLAGILSAAGLTFTETVKELNPALGETRVKADFAFTNQTDKTLVVKETLGDCSCTSIEISGGKRSYAPGESGVLRLNFDMGTFWGKVEKGASICLEEDAKVAPSHRLTLKVNIPILIEMEPKTVKWDTGQASGSKTIKFKMNGDKPIHIKSISTSTENFTQELRTIEDGRNYELVITPKDVQKRALTIFRVETDCELPNHRVQQVFAVVNPPVKAASK